MQERDSFLAHQFHVRSLDSLLMASYHSPQLTLFFLVNCFLSSVSLSDEKSHRRKRESIHFEKKRKKTQTKRSFKKCPNSFCGGRLRQAARGRTRATLHVPWWNMQTDILRPIVIAFLAAVGCCRIHPPTLLFFHIFSLPRVLHLFPFLFLNFSTNVCVCVCVFGWPVLSFTGRRVDKRHGEWVAVMLSTVAPSGSPVTEQWPHKANLDWSQRHTQHTYDGHISFGLSSGTWLDRPRKEKNKQAPTSSSCSSILRLRLRLLPLGGWTNAALAIVNDLTAKMDEDLDSREDQRVKPGCFE